MPDFNAIERSRRGGPSSFADRDSRTDAQKLGDEIVLIWVRDGEWGDTDLLAARRSVKGAKDWCNEHRKLEGAGDPIKWSVSGGAEASIHGVSANAVIDLGRHGKHKATRHYIFQMMNLKD